MKGMLVVGFVILAVVGFTIFIVLMEHRLKSLAGVRRRDNAQLRAQLTRANETITAVKRKVDDIGELNPVLANAVRPLVDGYLLEHGSKVK